MGAPGTDECERALSTLVGKCTEIGIPLATHKTEGPATSIKFLGIVIDTEVGELRLPADKLAHLWSLVADWAGRKAKGVGDTSGPPKSRVQGRSPRSVIPETYDSTLQQYRNKYHPSNWGCGAWHQRSWFQWKWDDVNAAASYCSKRAATHNPGNRGFGGGHGTGKKCSAIVTTRPWLQDSSPHPQIMHLLRCLYFVEAAHQFELGAPILRVATMTIP